MADAGATGAARALLRAGQLSQYLGNLEQAERLTARGEAALAPDDHAGHAIARLIAGTRAHKRGDAAAAQAHVAGALRAAELAGEERMIGWALNNLAALTGQAGDVVRAEDLMRRALESKLRAGANAVDIGRTLAGLADMALANGRWDDSADYAVRAIGVLARGGHARLHANALSTLAMARLRGGPDGDVAGATAAIDEATRLLDSFGEDRWIRGHVWARQSVILHAAGQRAAAAHLLTEAVAAMRSDPMRYHLPPIVQAHAELLAASGARPETVARLRTLATTIRTAAELTQIPLIME